MIRQVSMLLLVLAVLGMAASPAFAQQPDLRSGEGIVEEPPWLTWQLARRGLVGLVVAGGFAGLILRSRARSLRPAGRG